MKKFLFLCCCFAWAQTLPAQVLELVENVPQTLPSGISVTYTIRSSSQKDVGKKGEFSRHEVTVTVANDGGCDWIRVFTGNERTTNASEFPIVRVDCVNATGFRMTSKGDDIEGEQFNAIQVQRTTVNGQVQETRNPIHVGYALLRGRRIQKNYIYIVPLNEKPKVQVRAY
jgi:flagellar basal body rod protein FlgG